MSAYDRGVRLSAAAERDTGAPAPRRWMPTWAVPALAGMVLDIVAVAGTAWLITAARAHGEVGLGDALVRVGGMAALASVLLGAGLHTYGRPVLLAPPVARIFQVWGMAMLLVCAPASLILPLGTLPAGGLALFGILAPVALLAGREALSLLLATAFRRDWLPRRTILVLARSREDADALARRLRQDPDCRIAQPAALFDCEAVDLASADLVVIQAGGIRRADVGAALAALRAMPADIQCIAAPPEADSLRPAGSPLDAGMVIALKRGPLTGAERTVKRAVDVVVAGGALLLLAPLITALALSLRLQGGRPVLASRSVTDFVGRPVVVRTFSLPRRLEDRPGPWEGLRELPALLAVLAGRLALVGPAPLDDTADETDLAVARHAARQGLKPGLSVGSSRTTATQGRAADLAYCDQWSLGLDATILAGALARLCVEPTRPGR